MGNTFSGVETQVISFHKRTNGIDDKETAVKNTGRRPVTYGTCGTTFRRHVHVRDQK